MGGGVIYVDTLGDLTVTVDSTLVSNVYCYYNGDGGFMNVKNMLGNYNFSLTNSSMT